MICRIRTTSYRCRYATSRAHNYSYRFARRYNRHVKRVSLNVYAICNARRVYQRTYGAATLNESRGNSVCVCKIYYCSNWTGIISNHPSATASYIIIIVV